MGETKVPVTLRAIIQRINRRLANHSKVLKKTRGWSSRANLGEYYVLDFYRNVVVNSHVDPARLAQDLDVLAPWEAVVHEDEA